MGRSHRVADGVTKPPFPSFCSTNVPVSDLKPDPLNPRIHSERQIKQLAKSIKTFGFVSPVLIDDELRVIAGHGRIEAARLLGLTEVPSIRIHHLSEPQLRAFMIADNRLAEQASWDQRLLGEQLQALSEVALDFDLEATGFEVEEIDLLIEGLSPAVKGHSDPADRVPEISQIEVTREGDLWLLGRNRVYCGNPLNAQSYSTLMEAGGASMIFTEPNFNIAGPEDAVVSAVQPEFLSQLFSLLATHSEDGSLHYLCTGWPHISEVLAAGERSYTELKNVCVWVKDKDSTGSLYRDQHELIFVFRKGKKSHKNNVPSERRCRKNVWNYPVVKSSSRRSKRGKSVALHPTARPVSMVADAVLDGTARGVIVLDPFLGDGTTLVAAERTGRVCYGLEAGPKSVDSIIRRWQTFTGRGALHAPSGRTFADLETEAVR